ncbi:MAG: hypothetical protein NDJ72_09315 [Elusimicrobia bacterium]|nr:hypothetical protein [Elusimicrobiota bacterium]
MLDGEAGLASAGLSAMDLLLRLLERRVVVIGASLLAAVWIGGRWGGYAQGRADLMMHPPADAVSPLSVDIKKDVEARESAKLKGLHRAVSAEIAAAAANGYKVDKFQRLADSALRLDTPAYRPAAIERLNKLRLAIPQKKEAFRPAAAEDLNPDMFDTARPKGKASRR